MRDLRDEDLGVTLLLNWAGEVKSSFRTGDLTPRAALEDTSVRLDFEDKAGLVDEAFSRWVASRGVIGLFTARLEAREGRNGRLRLFGLFVLLSSGMFALIRGESSIRQHLGGRPCRGESGQRIETEARLQRAVGSEDDVVVVVSRGVVTVVMWWWCQGQTFCDSPARLFQCRIVQSIPLVVLT